MLPLPAPPPDRSAAPARRRFPAGSGVRGDRGGPGSCPRPAAGPRSGGEEGFRGGGPPRGADGAAAGDVGRPRRLRPPLPDPRRGPQARRRRRGERRQPEAERAPRVPGVVRGRAAAGRLDRQRPGRRRPRPGVVLDRRGAPAAGRSHRRRGGLPKGRAPPRAGAVDHLRPSPAVQDAGPAPLRPGAQRRGPGSDRPGDRPAGGAAGLLKGSPRRWPIRGGSSSKRRRPRPR